MPIAVLPHEGATPEGMFETMQEALFWGLHNYGGQAFVVRVLDTSVFDAPPADPAGETRRRPAPVRAPRKRAAG
jgi:hypothetical protein